MKGRRSALVLGLLMVAARARGQAPDPRLIVTEQTPERSISGRFADAGVVVEFTVREDDGERQVVFTENAQPLARFQASDRTGVARVTAGGASWGGVQPLPADRGPEIRALVVSPRGRAIREVAIHLPEKAPGPKYRRLRLTVLQLYGELAASDPGPPPPFSGRKLAMTPGADQPACAGLTEDALFDCVDARGRTAVVPLLDGLPEPRHAKAKDIVGPLHHDRLSCYGACGASCEGQCAVVPVDCVPGDQAGVPCYEPRPGTQDPYRPKLDFNVETASVCPAGSTLGGRAIACTSAECCFKHDECNRHDLVISLAAFVACQLWGLRECGFSAVFGIPVTPWDVKWFDFRGAPLRLEELPKHAGMCSGTVPPTWTGPDVVPHGEEQVACAVHGVPHREEACAPEGASWWRRFVCRVRAIFGY